MTQPPVSEIHFHFCLCQLFLSQGILTQRQKMNVLNGQQMNRQTLGDECITWTQQSVNFC